MQAKADGPAGLSAALLGRMDECSKALSKTRKKRVVSATLAAPEAVAELSLLAAQPLHKTSKVQGSWRLQPLSLTERLHIRAPMRRRAQFGYAATRQPTSSVRAKSGMPCCGVSGRCSTLRWALTCAILTTTLNIAMSLLSPTLAILLPNFNINPSPSTSVCGSYELAQQEKQQHDMVQGLRRCDLSC